MSQLGEHPVRPDLPDRTLRQKLQRLQNITGSMSVTDDNVATTTFVADDRIHEDAVIVLTPTTSGAAAFDVWVVVSDYVIPGRGDNIDDEAGFYVRHAATSTAYTYRYAILG